MERDEVIEQIKYLVMDWPYEKLLQEYLELLEHDLSKMDNKEVLNALEWYEGYNERNVLPCDYES